MKTNNQQEKYGQEMLEKAKSSFKTIVMDQDGTVKGGDDSLYKKASVVELLQKIARCGKYPAIITASGVSALKSFSPMNVFYLHESITTPTFIGIGNGTALYRFDRNGRNEIYNHSLTLDEVKTIVGVWREIYQTSGIKEIELQPKGIETFRKFIETDWAGYIPSEYIDIFRQYEGRCFTEQIKVTVVFPAWGEERQRELVFQMQSALNKELGQNKYLASRGDNTFLHITHTFEIDPKLFALQTIMKNLTLAQNQVVVFGDMPLDNDKGMLIDSGLPYTFTNREFEKKDLRKPPYILPGSSKSMVGSVYKAIDFLLS